jgi:riboflavin biosynthesis pyrimidine reductase
MAGFDELTVAQTLDAHAALRDWRADGATPGPRPRIAINMITSVDARVTKDGRSGGLSGEADRELFHALRAQADAVMAGANTARIERYGAIIRDPATRERRRAAGLRPQPYAILATRSGRIDPSLPLLADPDTHVIVVGPRQSNLPPRAARVDYIASATLDGAFTELHDRFGVDLVLCEGGPTLCGALFTAGLVDELFLTITPRLLGGSPGPTFIDSPPLEAETALTLLQLLRSGDELFARYRCGPALVGP